MLLAFNTLQDEDSTRSWSNNPFIKAVQSGSFKALQKALRCENVCCLNAQNSKALRDAMKYGEYEMAYLIYSKLLAEGFDTNFGLSAQETDLISQIVALAKQFPNTYHQKWLELAASNKATTYVNTDFAGGLEDDFELDLIPPLKVRA